MNHIVQTTLKITASAVIILVLAVGGGVAYSWYVSQHSDENSQAFQKPAPAVKSEKKPPKFPDDATMGVSVQSITSPVAPGSNSSIMVKTNPDATCSVSVEYNHVPSKDSGLAPKKADEYGLVEWTWTVESTAPVGNWPVKVSCANKKNTAVVENDLRIVRTLE